MADNGKRFVELFEKREKLEGTKIAGMLRNLATTQYTVNKNYKELFTAITGYEGNLEICNVNNRGELEAFLWELSRFVQNYVLSTYTLIEHNRRFCQKLKCSELDKLYSKEIDILQSYDCVKFVKELRRFSQHLGLPLLAGHISISKSDFKQNIIFQKEELNKWNEWSLTSKKYINSKKEIEPKLVFEEYQFLISNFYDWFYRTVSRIYERQLREFSEVESELARLSP